MKELCLGVLAVAIFATAGSVQAQDREHDGFMLRLTAGGGYGAATEDLSGQLDSASELKIDGGGVMFSVDVGGSPIENLVLHGRFGAMVVSSPTIAVDGRELDVEQFYGEDESSLSFILFGPAVTYYIMPANIYLTGAFGLGLIGLRVGDQSSRTDPGWALNLDAGWEFWVGQSWAMGPALRFFYTSVPDDDELTVNGTGFGVLFSATYQ